VKTKSEYTKEEYVKELVSLWEDAVRVVYLKQPTNYGDELAQRAWDGTNMTPIRYVMRVADPKYVTNMIGRGQKAREKRWNKWVKKHEKANIPD
jgi:hypothetical protein